MEKYLHAAYFAVDVLYIHGKRNHVRGQRLILAGANVAKHSTYVVKAKVLPIVMNVKYFHAINSGISLNVGFNMDKT